ncbi:MAG: hypothetical protein ACK5MN_00535 [Lachnospiraceae bacterium]
MIKQSVLLGTEEEKIVAEVMKSSGLKSGPAIRHIIQAYGAQEKDKELEVKRELGLLKKMQRDAEEMQEIILDAVNTILQEGDYDLCYTQRDQPHPVITQSREQRKAHMAKLKQYKDSRKHRRYS